MPILPTEKSNREEFYKWLRSLANDSQVKSGENLDKIILGGAAGALVLSLGTLGNFSAPTGLAACFLLLAWISLLSALLTHALSYRESVRYNKSVIKLLDEWQRRDFEDPVFALPKPKQYYEAMDGGRNRIDEFAFWSMVVGIIFLAVSLVPKLTTNPHDRRCAEKGVGQCLDRLPSRISPRR